MTTTNRERTPLPAADDGAAGPSAAVPDRSQPATLDQPSVTDARPVEGPREGAPPAQPPPAPPPGRREDSDVDLSRIAWVLTVLVCAIVVIVLVLEGYFGYAGVTFAVGAAAAINLT
jgi:hypothetical protein